MPRDKQYTPEEVEQKFEEYRDQCLNFIKETATNSGKVLRVKTPRVMSIEGFAKFLRVDRSTLENYRKAEGYEEYFRILKKIDGEVYHDKVDALLNGDGSTPGLIFNMKAKEGWIDKQVQDITHRGFRLEVVQTDEPKDE